jgi:polyferredoxin
VLRKARTAFQVAVVVAAGATGVRYALGWSRTSVETYCPFGGLEAAYSLLTQQQFTCATGERNLALLAALLALTLAARKSFCSWVCPVGAISEWCSAIGRRLFPRRKDGDGLPLHALEPPRPVDRGLRWLRLPVLAVILYFTYRSGELVFRGYDPYYIMFSAHGHDVRLWSYAVLAAALIGVVIVPMAWCRYLCPLGVVLWPFSAVGRLRLARDSQQCTSCGLCDRSCPHSIEVSRLDEIRSGECTLCFECTDSCPEAGALQLVVRGVRR